jgi:hypothetical protein
VAQVVAVVMVAVVVQEVIEQHQVFLSQQVATA